MTRRCRWAPVVALLLVVAGACGGDDAEDPGDEASFCLLAVDSAPVAEADLETLERLAELAPVEIRDQVAVLLDLAVQVDEAGVDSADALAIEFDVRFSDEYIEARRDVERYLRTECDDGDSRVTTTTAANQATTSTTSSTSTTSGASLNGGDDGDDDQGE